MSKMLFGKPATTDGSEIRWLGACVEPSDRFHDHPQHRKPQKDPAAAHTSFPFLNRMLICQA